MKFVMFTPAVTASAIGRMTSMVTRALVSHGHEIVVVRAEEPSMLAAPSHDFGVRQVPWTESAQVESALRGAEAIFYQIGDNYTYHQGCLAWLPHAPGIVCLHDFFLGHLFTGWSQGRLKEAHAILRAWYGLESADQFFSYHSANDFIAGTQDSAPLTEWVSAMAQAIITHSSWGLPRVLSACAGPVEVVPLAYAIQKDSSGVPPQPVSDADFTILTVGHVNANKRAESVIRAIGRSAVLKEHAIYRLVGAVQPVVADQLSSLARDMGVRLVISGEVDSDTLSSALCQADVVSCLRWPSLEAASASAIEAMMHGKSVIVTNTGFYAELPDTCVRKISPENEIPDMQQALEYLYQNSVERAAMGEAAAQWALSTFTADNYARRLVAVSSAAQRAKPVISALQALTAQQRRWGASERLVMLSDTLVPLRLFDACGDQSEMNA